MKKLMLLTAILAVGSTAFSETIGTQKLDATVISQENFETTVQKVAKDIQIVTAEDIANKGATTIADALKGVPGLTISKLDGKDATFDLRGFGGTAASNTLVLLDGVPINSLQNNDYSTSQIPVSSIEQIEIIPAGGNVMYGGGTTGGVINIITKGAQNKTNYGSVGLEASSYSTTDGNLNYGTKIGNNLLFDISYNHHRSKNYRHCSNDKFNNPDERQNIWLKGKYLLENGKIEARYRHTDNDDYYASGLSAEQYHENPKQSSPYGGYAKSKQDSYLVKYDTKVIDNLDFMIYGGYDEYDYHGDSLGKRGPWITKYKTKQGYTKGQLKYTYAPNSYVILGGDYNNGKYEDKKEKTNPDQKREIKAGYIMNKFTLDNLELTQGIRNEHIKFNFDNEDKKFSKNSYELGANYLYSDTGSLYLSYNRGFRAPTIQDMNWWAGDKKLQKSDSYEIGIRDMVGNTYISTSIFNIDTENEIYYDGDDSNDPVNRTNKNFDGKVRRRGANLNLAHYFDGITLREGLSYIQPKVKTGKYSGHDFPQVARWNANLGVTATPVEKVTLNVDMYYHGKSYIGDDFENKYEKLKDYITWDTNVRYQFNEGLELYAGVRNLFNKKYPNAVFGRNNNTRNYNVADGRAYYGGFKYTF